MNRVPFELAYAPSRAAVALPIPVSPALVADALPVPSGDVLSPLPHSASLAPPLVYVVLPVLLVGLMLLLTPAACLLSPCSSGLQSWPAMTVHIGGEADGRPRRHKSAWVVPRSYVVCCNKLCSSQR